MGQNRIAQWSVGAEVGFHGNREQAIGNTSGLGLLLGEAPCVGRPQPCLCNLQPEFQWNDVCEILVFTGIPLILGGLASLGRKRKFGAIAALRC